MSAEISGTVIQRLKKLAERKIPGDDPEDYFNPGDGGNFDDTYNNGVEDGETCLAREILDGLGIEYEIEK